MDFTERLQESGRNINTSPRRESQLPEEVADQRGVGNEGPSKGLIRMLERELKLRVKIA